VLLVKEKRIKEGRFLVVRFIIKISNRNRSRSSSSSSSSISGGGDGGGHRLMHLGELHSPFSFPLYV
jgi:uncharacterized membrane protein